MPEEVFGLPTHPLLVHLPVVLGPLTAVGALVMLLRTTWRKRYGWLVALGAVGTAIGVQLAMMSGEAFEEGEGSALVARHADLAEQARPWVFLFAAIAVVVFLIDRYGAKRLPPDRLKLSTRMACMLLAIGSVISTVEIIRTGHAGSKAVWQGEGEREGRERPSNDNRGPDNAGADDDDS